MTDERRRYYRIADRALIKYRVITEDALQDERRYVFLNEVKASNVHAALMGIDLRFHELLEAVRGESRAVAEAIELLNRKVTLLERVVALENAGSAAIDYRDHEPVEISISGGGLALEAVKPLALNANLAIDMILLPSNHPMRVIGKVVDCRKTDSGNYAIAIEFEEMRDDDRDLLIQHIVRKQSAVLREERGLDRDHAA